MKEPIEDQDPLRPHIFDGIQEYDKALPNWWLFTFYATFVFSIGYWIYYHKTSKGPDQHQEYDLALAAFEESLAAARESAPELTDDVLIAMSEDASIVEEGKKHYDTNCFTCHGTDLQGPAAVGMPGVSLVDAEWIHGYAPMEIRKTIMEGVLAKGMPPWEPVLGEKRINAITAFILSKQVIAPSERKVVSSEAAPVASSPEPVASPELAKTDEPPSETPETTVPKADADPGITNEALVAMSQDAVVVAAGQQRYATLCVACHGAELQGPPVEGMPGVSLVDAEWIYGNEPLQIRHTILKGKIEKGMAPWEAVVGEDGANELVAYILSKQEK